MNALSVRRDDSMKACEVNVRWMMGRPVSVLLEAAMASSRWSRG